MARREIFGPYQVTYQDEKISVELHPRHKINSRLYSWISQHFKQLEIGVEEEGIELLSKEILSYLKKKEGETKNKEGLKESFFHIFSPDSTEKEGDSWKKVRNFLDLF